MDSTSYLVSVLIFEFTDYLSCSTLNESESCVLERILRDALGKLDDVELHNIMYRGQRESGLFGLGGGRVRRCELLGPGEQYAREFEDKKEDVTHEIESR